MHAIGIRIVRLPNEFRPDGDLPVARQASCKVPVMDLKTLIGHELPSWTREVWFQVGNVPVSFARVLGLVLIVLLVWWFASLLENAIRRVAVRAGRGDESAPAVYAWTRILRYTVWVIGTLFGLSYTGLDLTSFALLGGAIGVGIGFRLQNIFSNFISGIIILLERTLKVGDFVDLQSGVRGHVRSGALKVQLDRDPG